jgi:hypothetical protein
LGEDASLIWSAIATLFLISKIVSFPSLAIQT